jgi:hypothetical protein
MRKIIRTLLFLTLFLTACSPASLSPEAPSFAVASSTPTPIVIPVAKTEAASPPKMIATISTPHIDQGPDGAVTSPPSRPQDCGYQWAQQALPELSSQFLLSIPSLQPEAQANAYAFGENCLHSDGNVIFLPMETDFNVTLRVSELSDETVFGEWIMKVMKVIEDIPPDQIIGPRPGRVGIVFESNDETQAINFYIDQYRALPEGLNSAEIYQSLKTAQ